MDVACVDVEALDDARVGVSGVYFARLGDEWADGVLAISIFKFLIVGCYVGSFLRGAFYRILHFPISNI